MNDGKLVWDDIVEQAERCVYVASRPLTLAGTHSLPSFHKSSSKFARRDGILREPRNSFQGSVPISPVCHRE